MSGPHGPTVTSPVAVAYRRGIVPAILQPPLTADPAARVQPSRRKRATYNVLLSTARGALGVTGVLARPTVCTCDDEAVPTRRRLTGVGIARGRILRARIVQEGCVDLK